MSKVKQGETQPERRSGLDRRTRQIICNHWRRSDKTDRRTAAAWLRAHDTRVQPSAEMIPCVDCRDYLHNIKEWIDVLGGEVDAYYSSEELERLIRKLASPSSSVTGAPRGCWFHDWVYVGLVNFTIPLRGPYDPRSEEARTRKRTKKVCAKCGKEKFESRGCR